MIVLAEGFAAGRAAASPDPDPHTVCVKALTEWWTSEATAAEVTGWMNGALQAARLPQLDRKTAISMCSMVMADLGGECDYGAVVSNVLRAAYPAASPDERLREAGERLAQTVAQVCGEGHPALGMWRVALAAADRLYCRDEREGDDRIAERGARDV